MIKKRKNKKLSFSVRAEKYIDRHNHKLELIRTIGTIVSILIFLKVFGII